MTAALTRCESCENLSRLKTQGLFLREWSLFKWINRVWRLSDFHKTWPVYVCWISMHQIVWGFYQFPNTILMAPQSLTCIEHFSVQLQSGFTREPIKISKKASHTLLGQANTVDSAFKAWARLTKQKRKNNWYFRNLQFISYKRFSQ